MRYGYSGELEQQFQEIVSQVQIIEEEKEKFEDRCYEAEGELRAISRDLLTLASTFEHILHNIEYAQSAGWDDRVQEGFRELAGAVCELQDIGNGIYCPPLDKK